MFLHNLIDNNSAFVQAATKLHQSGELEPNTYVIDLETVRKNSSILAENAKKNGLHLYGMTKQLGYNPLVQQAVTQSGIGSFVAVDWMGARLLHQQGYKLGHVGHLVQPPTRFIPELAAMRPEVVTVFSMEKARTMNEACKQIGVQQDILLRVYGPDATFYPGHEGGFALNDVVDAAREIGKLTNLRIVGTTCFPCLLFNENAKDVLPTSNFKTVIEAARLLEIQLGIKILQINVPGTNSSDVFEKIAALGGTHVEPGHALTGTIPLATVRDVQETPAMLYLSEISHIHNGRGHVFGGGLYVDRVRGRYNLNVAVGTDLQQRTVELIPDDGIDYYGYVNGDVKEGDSVIFGFRAQIFVTRGQVAVVDGVSTGNPQVLGYYDANGHPIKRG